MRVILIFSLILFNTSILICQTYQIISGTFSSAKSDVDAVTHLEYGKILPGYCQIQTEDSFNEYALIYQFEEDYVNEDIDITFSVNSEVLSVQVLNGNIFITENSIQTLLYSGGLFEGNVLSIGFIESSFFLQLNEQLLYFVNASSTFGVVETEMLVGHTDQLEGTLIMSNEFVAPQIGVSFVDQIYYVPEGEDLAVQLQLDIVNQTNNNITVEVEFDSNISPHFDDQSGAIHTLTFLPGEQGPKELLISSDLANETKDGNLLYKLKVGNTNTPLAIKGQLDVCNIQVVDDFIPINNNLKPGDLMIVGYDNDILGSSVETDRLVITNLTELEPGTSFQIVKAAYHSSNSLWTSSDLTDGKIVSHKITYNGASNLPLNSIICLDIPSSGLGESLLVNNILLDGTPTTDFFVSNKSISDDPNLNIPLNTSSSIFLLQGEWVYYGFYSGLIGSVIHGISIGTNWSTGSPMPGQSNIPEMIECFETNGPNMTGSLWAYFHCQNPFSEITIMDLREQIADFSNWTSGVGTNDLDFNVEVCSSSCEIVDAYDNLTIVVNAEDLIIECDGTVDPGNSIDYWLANYGWIELSGGCYPISVSNNFSTIDPNSCASYPVEFTITDACGVVLTSVANIIVEDNTPPILSPLPQDVTLPIDCNLVPSAPSVTASDVCDDEVIPVLFTENIDFVNGDYSFTRIWEATDACGNYNSHVQSISVSNSNVLSTINSNESSLCGTGAQYFINFSTSVSAGSILWDFGTDASPPSSTSNGPISVNWSSSGTKTISLEVTDGYCYSSDIQTVQISSVNTTITNGSILHVCENDQVTLNATSSGGVGPYTYEWFQGSTLLGTGPSYTFTATSSSYYITTKATDINGCVGVDACSIYTVDADINVSSAYSEVCRLFTFTINYNTAPNVTYSFPNQNDGRVITNYGNGFIQLYYNTPGTKNVVILGTHAQNNSCVIYGDYSLTVRQDPMCTISGPTTVCEGESFTLSSPGESNFTYNWINPQNITTNTVDYFEADADPVTDSGQYWLLVWDDIGCYNECYQTLNVNSSPNCIADLTVTPIEGYF